MELKLREEPYFFDVLTSGPTGALANADSLPTWVAYEDGSDSPILSGTAIKRVNTTGQYYVSIVNSTGNGFEDGKSYNITAAATVGGIPVGDIVASFIAVTATLSDLIVQAQTTVRAGDGNAIILIDAAIERLSANPRPDYSIDGESYSWGSLLSTLVNLRAQLRSQQISDEPFELISQGVY